MVVDATVAWLEPFPDRAAGDPAAAALGREPLGLAFEAALQTLSARQRAVLILREVLQWPATDVADCLDISVAAVNSGLQRARAAVRSTAVAQESLSLPDDPEARAVVDRYVDAFVRADLGARPIAANGQPGFAAYALGADGDFHAHSLQVFTTQAGMVAHNVVFGDPMLFRLFGLASSLPAEGSHASQ
ncbi:MAG TPA: sigma factor-like helix-turn-helix DNA-binding protein [Pseudonocardia sp.]